MLKANSTIDGVLNFRDLGGLPLIAGGTTKPNIVFRSAALGEITPTGLQQLAATDIGMIADLRTEQERAERPDILPDTRLFEKFDVAIQVGNMSAPSGNRKGPKLPKFLRSWMLQLVLSRIPDLGHLYELMLMGAAPQFAQVAELTAQVKPELNNAVLIHCTAGKDRTGIASALILDTVGVKREAIVQNYAESQKNLAGPWAEGMLDNLKKSGIPLTKRLVALVTTTPPEAMETALAWIDKHHGSSADYLISGGVSPKTIDQLKAVLT